MRAIVLLGLSFAFVTLLSAPTSAQQQAKHPTFTLVSRVTVTKPDGKQEVSETTRYVSSDGSVREISREQDGTVSSDYIYESGRGGFNVQSKDKKLVKRFGSPPEASGGTLPTAESLRADPNFAGTEQILGYTVYIIRQRHKEQGVRDRDLYYAPELGRTPLKTVRYSGGKAFVVYEPVSVTFGEPEAALMKAPPDYEVRPLAPISAGILNGKAVSKPNPVWPKEARGIKGTVSVQILADEDGKIIKAEAVSGPEQLQQAAVEAAYKARLSPTRLSGQPVKVSGVLVYNFL
ncbi:MAG TPA: energy transducer TonB [Pyrinomonadaceae bacterium]|nr:energy transducer TonB [Pyrinomonadaceae bacterium]